MNAMAVNEFVQVETPVLTVTEAASQMIRTLLDQRQIPNHALRVFVSGGGCSGMQYGMAFEENPKDFDQVVEANGVRLIIDPTSMMYLQGANIDFVDSLMGGGFRIDNPNAVSSCGCGHSFRTASDSSGGEAGCGTCSH
jgi:iron-sulfur cluster assembly protein